MFSRSDHSKIFFDVASNMSLDRDNFIWITSEAMGTNELIVEPNKNVTEGVITLEMDSRSVGKFDDWFLQLHPTRPRVDFPFVQNPWIVEYWEDTFQCRMPPNLTRLLADSSTSATQRLHSAGASSTSAFYNGLDYYGDRDATQSSFTRVAQQREQSPSLEICDAERHRLKGPFTQDTKLQFVVDSVYAFAHALNEYLR